MYNHEGRQVAESLQVAAGSVLVWSAENNSFVFDGSPGALVPTRTMEYDSQGRLMAVELPAVVDPLNANTLTRPRYEYGYDERGNQILIRDPNLHETRFEFNLLGQQVSRTSPVKVNGKRPSGP